MLKTHNSIESESTIGDIKIGDYSQLNYIKERYNYLFHIANELQEEITGRMYEKLPVIKHIQNLNVLQEEMLELDNIRTQIVTPKNGRELFEVPQLVFRPRKIWSEDAERNNPNKQLRERKYYGSGNYTRKKRKGEDTSRNFTKTEE